MTAPESVPEVRDEWVEKAAQALHETTAHPTAWVDLPDWMLNEARFKARAALAAVVPLIEADVGERIAAAMVETPADRVTWDDGTEFISSADAQRIARAVATGDEGGQ